MAASTTIYCLEKTTDYSEFERLCNDIMAGQGYANIEPLGGAKDEGRDAIHIDSQGITTIFAYSVRMDWRAKLAQDAARIEECHHDCHRLVFVTTSRVTTGARDEAKSAIDRDYGWELEIYGLERLRVLLDNHHPELKLRYPQIFDPAFLAAEATLAHIDRKHILIIHNSSDRELAVWLARKLVTLGFFVWCGELPYLVEETYPTEIESAIQNDVIAAVVLFSSNSLQDPELVRKSHLAIQSLEETGDGMVVPVRVDDFSETLLDSRTRALGVLQFGRNWANGLRKLTWRLESHNCPKHVDSSQSYAIRSLLEQEEVVDEPETLFSNCFEVLCVPERLIKISFDQDLDASKLNSARFFWAFRKIDPRTFLSFGMPPEPILPLRPVRDVTSVNWRQNEFVEGINAKNVVSELIRKSFIVKCQESGLHYCKKTNMQYFPYDSLIENNRLKYMPPWGKASTINVAGQRTYWTPSKRNKYTYYLSPDFYVRRDLFSEFVVLLNVRVRIASVDGLPLDARPALVRRKHLCKDWWNFHWLKRTVAIADFLSEEGTISLDAHEGEQLLINCVPYHVYSPSRILEN